MKKYISHKTVHAEPMTRREGVENGVVRDVVTPDNIDDKGYKVVYEDGYESWSPKEAFDEGYTEVTDA